MPHRYESFFQPLQIGALSLPNRLAMAPMTRRQCPAPHVPTDAMAAYYARRAAGGVGLIITEGTHIDSLHAWDTDTVPRIETDAQVDGWRSVVDAVHAEGGRIAVQLWHTGRHAADPIAPSAIPAMRADGTHKATPRAMESADLDQIRSAFARAAERAREAGFDAVEIHGAHGYILDSFLSPEANVRRDAYGGSFENRMRFPLEVVRAVRAAVGSNYPIIYRFSQWKVDDYTALNFPDPEILGMWVRALREAGADLLHVSTRDATEPAWDHSDTTLAGWTRELSGLPVIAVGRVSTSASMGEARSVETTDPAPAAALIKSGEADLIAIGRALIPNPDWPQKVRTAAWRDLVPYDAKQLEALE